MGRRLASPVFVGRREALATAAEVLGRVADRRASHLLVSGEAGIGKTRFAEEVGERARSAGFIVLRGGCVALRSGELPYAPLAEALRELTLTLGREALVAVMASDRATLARLVPSLLEDATGVEPAAVEWTPSPTADAQSLEMARARLLEALLGTLERLAEASPVLLIVDDLQWADSASLDTLAYVIASVRSHRVGLLLTFRSDEIHRRHPLRPWLGQVERLDAVTSLELGPFAAEETRELVAAIRGAEPTPDLVERIRAHSDGNPYFIVELLAVDGAAPPGGLPPTLRDVLQARITSLPDAAQALLAVVAIAGRAVESSLLAEVSGLATGELSAALAASLERRLLVALGDSRDRVAFRHALLAEAVLDGILPGERVRLHRALAAALEGALRDGRVQTGAWAELADHWDAARDERQAFAAALRAAVEAERACAFEAALAQYRRALAAWDLVSDAEAVAGFDHVDLLARAAVVASLADREGPIPLLRAAIREADRGGDATRGALLRSRLGFALWLNGERAAAGYVYGQALARMPSEPATSERAWVLARYAQCLMLEGRERESAAVARAAVDIACEVGDRRVEGHALNTLGSLMAYHGNSDLGVDHLERALAIAVELGDPDDMGRAYLNATEALADCGREGRALELAREGIERAQAMGTEHTYGAFIRHRMAAILYGLGRWQEAASILGERPLRLTPPGGQRADLARAVEALAITVEIPVGTGDWTAASATLAALEEQLARFEPEYQYAGPFASASAELALWQARPRDALASIDLGLSRIERTEDRRNRLRLLRLGLRAAADLAGQARDRRDVGAESEALAVAGDLRARTEAAVAVTDDVDGGLAAELAAEIATADAETTRLRGSSEPAAWHEAANRWSARRRPYCAAYATWRGAEASLGRRDRAGAREALREAAAIAAGLGARPLLRSIEALARRARIPLERPTDDETRPETAGAQAGDLVATRLGLTAREREVLQLVAQGLTNRQIAAALYISVYTAEIHVSRILRKLDAISRTEAAARAHHLGLVAG